MGVAPFEYWEVGVGVNFLRGTASRDEWFIEGLFLKRIVRVVELLHLLSQQMDSQSKLLQLWLCMGIVKLFFGLRACQPIWFDKEFQRTVEDIKIGEGVFFMDLQ